MSESAEPAAVELQECEDQEQREHHPQEHDEDKDVSDDNSGSEEADITSEEKEEIRTQENTSDPNRTIEFQPILEENMERECAEEQIQEVAQDDDEDEEDEEQCHSQGDNQTITHLGMSEHKIEDESMPSLVSSTVDESDLHCKLEANRRHVEPKDISPKSSPKREEQQDDSDDSVCVIDDDDDDDIGIPEQEGDDSSMDEDEDISSSYEDDSDGMERDNHFNDHYNKINKNVRDIDIDVEEDNEDDEEEENEDEDEDEEDNESEAEGFDGGSDDLVIRHSNGLSKHQKERSSSLQDLSLMKGESPKKKRFNPFSQKARYERSQANVDHRLPKKQFAHVESKVKKYIADIKEQGRKSQEHRQKIEQDLHDQKKVENNVDEVYHCEEEVSNSEKLKNFMEKTPKRSSVNEENEMFFSQSIENGEISIFPRQSISNGEVNINQNKMEIDPINLGIPTNEIRIDKVNGAVNEVPNSYESMRGGILRSEENPKPVLNGIQIESVGGMRELSYSEYMSAQSNKPQNMEEEDCEIEEIEDIEEEEEEEEVSPKKCNVNEPDIASLFRIDKVESNYINKEMTVSYNNPKNFSPLINQPKGIFYQENPDALRIALDQRNAQFDNLRDAYQRTLSENMAMKMELENLRKTLLQSNKEDTADKKNVTCQTEYFTRPTKVPNIKVDLADEEPNQTQPESINSAMSHWSDITGSVVNSSIPPHIDSKILNSDESTIQAKLKQRNPFSQAYLTSTKILQTLAKITRGKPKADLSKSFIPEAEASTSTQNEEDGLNKSRKRKATDTMDNSTKSFKIPFIGPSEKKRKRSSKSPESQTDNVIQEIDVENSDNDADAEKKETTDCEINLEELGDDVKIFQYEDDNDGAKSFLIQANESSINAKTAGLVRECGPYLLGNIEVYMTEKDGTINIWGKELNPETQNKNKEKEESSSKLNRSKTESAWQQSTPRNSVFQPQSLSTGKKFRTASRFGYQQHHSCDPLVEHDNCGSHSRVHPCSCNHYCNRVEEPHCGCTHKRYPRCSLPDVRHNNCCSYSNHCKNYPRRHSFTPSDEEEETSEGEEKQRNSGHSNLEDTLVAQSSSLNANLRNTASTESYDNELDPLIRRPNPDKLAHKRRSGSKKVKGLLMSILKGCGDCRAPIDRTSVLPAAFEASNSVQKEDSPTNQLATPSPNEKNVSSNNSLITAKLDALHAELERLRSEEDALRKMVRASSGVSDQ